MASIDEFFFAWEGASHPDGPWQHLRVLEFQGDEAISELFRFDIQLVRTADAPDVDVDALIGARAALLWATRTDPPYRLVHGIVGEAQELGEMEYGTRYRVVLVPPFTRAAMMSKSLIYLDKTLEQIIDQTLQRQALGAGLKRTAERGGSVGGDRNQYQPPENTYTWRIVDAERLTDPEARPYCVQYDETDFAFVSRLLEEEGISYHFEHDDRECRLVLTDFDAGRYRLEPDEPLSPSRLGREVHRWNVGRSLRPRSVHLDDFNWRKPKLDLRAQSPSGVTDFTHIVHPGRYEHSRETGQRLAEKREQRFDTERQYASAEARCRLLGAGTVFTLEHPTSKLSGNYLVTRLHYVVSQRGSFAAEAGEQEAYRCHIECLRCGRSGEHGESNFRPARQTPRPRIYGTQTAFVTAEPHAQDAEINVGGPEDLGCVRLRFHWDMDGGRHAEEPTSCWVRVSQFFAGSNHGAMWHPRVGDEVIVEYLDGDPDRPIVTGRVYNGVNLPPEDATARPTYSAIKSLTSPYDGNYNLIAFEDLQGSEEIIVHAARDYNTNVERNATRGVGVNESIHVKGDQSITIEGSQTTTIGGGQSVNVTGDQSTKTSVTLSESAGANIEMTAGSNITADAGSNIVLGAGGVFNARAGAVAIVYAPVTDIIGVGLARVQADGSLVLTGGATALLKGGGTVTVKGGGSVTVTAPTVNVEGGTVNVKGGSVNIEGGDVNVKGGSVNLNC